jgi:hypothetical protein
MSANESNEVANEAKAFADILQWSEECCIWQQDALRRLYNGALAEDDIDPIVAICKGNSAAAVPLSPDHVKDPMAAANVVNLSAVHSVENVNALAPDQRLTFDKSGMTVLYGDNGAGNSGYIRILKKVCRARSPRNDKIEPNVYVAKIGPQRACVKFSVEGQNHDAPWEYGKSARIPSFRHLTTCTGTKLLIALQRRVSSGK